MAFQMRLVLAAACLLSVVGAAKWTISPGSGYTKASYVGLVATISSRLTSFPNASLCLAHSMDGAEALLRRATLKEDCSHGMVTATRATPP